MIRKEGRARKTPGLAEGHRDVAQGAPLKFVDHDDKIAPQLVIKKLCEMTKGEAIITTGVGQHQMWAGQFYDFTKPRTFLTSADSARWASAIRPRSARRWPARTSR
jgi:thiamine pyrophosphate-dependent acetolactate synthase large subunit-like protein